MWLLVNFVIENFPTWREFFFLGPLWLLYSFASLGLAAFLKHNHSWKTGYTRKVFHFLTFGMAAALQAVIGTRAVCLFGGMASLSVFYAVWCGDGHVLYEAIAREKDAPHRTLHIIVPYFATLLGGLASAIMFGPFAAVGFLVTGLGDAIGEPVGTRFGRHAYLVPSMRSVKSTRTLEGSTAVMIVSLFATAVGAMTASHVGWTSYRLMYLACIAIACALCEAISPHGWDNLTMQVVPAWLATLAFV